MHRSVRFLFTVAIGAVSLFGCRPEVESGLPAEDTAGHLVILQINDTDTLYPVGRAKSNPLPRVVALVKKIRVEEKDVLFIHAGDMLSPAVDSNIFRGRQMVEAMNLADLDLAVLGNHEFDFGHEVLEQRIEEAMFPWLGANVFLASTGQPLAGLETNVLREVGGIKVGIFGIVTQESALTPAAEGMTFASPLVIAGDEIRRLKAQGAEIIIALTHLGIGEDMELARRYPEIVHISGGHDHDVMTHFTERTTITKGGANARVLVRNDLFFTRHDGRIAVDRTVEALPIDETIVPDRDLQQLVDHYNDTLQKEMEVVVGNTSVSLDARASFVRNHESSFGNFMTDTAREALDADIAMLNSGSIRANTVFEPGPLSRGMIFSLLPYESYLVKLELKGKQVLDALEHAVSHVGESYGRFPQVSGLTMKVRCTADPGARVSEVTVNDRPLDLTATYSLVTNTFLFEGGDGFTMFEGAKVLLPPASAPLLKNVIFARFKREETISPRVEGRIVRGDAPVRPPAQRVIIDVDPSVDSALAMLLLLRTPGVGVEAVTVVEGMSSVVDGGRNAQRILDLAGKPDIPVYLGEAGVPEGGHPFPAFHQEESARLGGANLPPPSRPPQRERAGAAIASILKASPGEITVIALGPLTNIAAALASDPSIATQARTVVAMGGAVRVRGNVDRPFVGFHNSVAEWNFFADPRAAARVVDAFPKVVFAGLDAVEYAPVTPMFVKRLGEIASSSPIPGFAHAALSGSAEAIKEGNFYFWDALTAAAAVNPSLVTCSETAIVIHTQPLSHAGWTEEVMSGGRRVEVCTSADRAALEDYFLRVVTP